MDNEKIYSYYVVAHVMAKGVAPGYVSRVFNIDSPEVTSETLLEWQHALKKDVVHDVVGLVITFWKRID